MWPFRRKRNFHYQTPTEDLTVWPVLPWADWWREEEEREAQRIFDCACRGDWRRSRHIQLTDDVMDRIDLVAKVQGVSRHALIEMGMNHYLASWRDRPVFDD
jgi:hypothetical protein